MHTIFPWSPSRGVGRVLSGCRFLLVACVVGAGPYVDDARADDAANDVLIKVDQSLGHVPEGLSFEARAECYDVQAAEVKRCTYAVRSKGNSFKGVASGPATCSGDVILVNGRTIWVRRAKGVAPEGIVLTARRSGIPVLGDIMATSFAELYRASPKGKETVDGVSTQTSALKSVRPAATYAQATMWIDDAHGLALKVDLLGVNGAVERTASFEYEQKLRIGSRAMPFVSRMVVREADAKQPCFIEFSKVATASVAAGELDPKTIGVVD